MPKKKTETVISKEPIAAIEIKDEKQLDKLLSEQSDGKVSFAKIVFPGNRGPYIVAFEDSVTKDYCECNALDFKSIAIKDIKSEELPIWECGAKDPEQINKLPKMNIKEFINRASKEKEDKKAARAEKMAKVRAAKK